MKPRLLIPVIAIAAGIFAHGQSPNTPPPPPPQPNPGGQNQPQSGGPSGERREHFRKMAEQFRGQRGPGAEGGQQVNPQERAEHIREAMKHLHAAGLGQMAERFEQSLKQHMEHGQGPGRPQGGPPQAQNQQQPRPPGGPQRQFSRPSPLAPGAPGAAANSSGGGDELRAQLQKLQREVEELRNMIRSRGAGNEDGPRPSEPNRAEHRESGTRPQADRPPGAPRDADRRDRPPQGEQREGDRRPQGERPQARPQDGERRPQGDQPGRGESGPAKPAQDAQSDSIE